MNLKERDEFHLTLEEYLQSLISLVEELVRCPGSHPIRRLADSVLRLALHATQSLLATMNVHFSLTSSSRTSLLASKFSI